MPSLLSVFDKSEFSLAKHYLASQVIDMMGRKYEEGDWADVYCRSKGIPASSWSNLSIDIIFGNLGVEHKMMCRPSHKPILDACGTSLMHPAGTRAIRIPKEEDPTIAAQNVLSQYCELIDNRSKIVETLYKYGHSRIDRDQAIVALMKIGFTKSGAEKEIPIEQTPIGSPDQPIDMRFGWLLWQKNLEEFLYFEEPMTKPNPTEFIAEWRSSGGGRRRTSRNLWVYEKKTGNKKFSITTEAGAKIQPYFEVPSPNSANLYHFIVQGEVIDAGMVRVWLSKNTVEALERTLGSLTPKLIGEKILEAELDAIETQADEHIFSSLPVEVAMPADAYKKLYDGIDAVNDEHRVLKFLKFISDV